MISYLTDSRQRGIYFVKQNEGAQFTARNYKTRQKFQWRVVTESFHAAVAFEIGLLAEQRAYWDLQDVHKREMRLDKLSLTRSKLRLTKPLDLQSLLLKYKTIGLKHTFPTRNYDKLSIIL